jgi:hypothetical protein
MGFNGHLAQQQFWEAHVRFGSKADVTPLNFDVRFTPKSGRPSAQSKCPLWAKTRLMRRSNLPPLLQALSNFRAWSRLRKKTPDRADTVGARTASIAGASH